MLRCIPTATVTLVLAAAAFAAPQGEQVVGGSAHFDRAGDVTTITTSHTAIINYDSFNIAGHETVRFVQPGADSRVLNRIAGSDPTRIDGSLMANGIVYIVNPAGVYFANGALVNVGGLYAGAANLTNADFIANVNHFTGVTGNVINEGTIDASLVALVGRHVANYGSIRVPDGMVTMVSGDDVLIAERDRSFMVRIEGLGAEAAEAANDAEAGVVNAGTIDAGRGSVVWGAGDIYAMGIHQTGTVRAARVEAKADTAAHLGGTIDASSDEGVGGRVTATADRLAVSGTIDASGEAGGGEIKLGGDWQGGGEIEHAGNTLITRSAHLIASAISNGAGGTIVMWSDGTTAFLGTAEARGAPGEAGGNIETSGHTLLIQGGTVAAPGGTWLLDPFNVEAGDFGGAGSGAGGSFDAANPNTWTPSASPSQVDVADIMNSLNAGTSVTITTTGGGAEDGDISVTAPIMKTAGGDAVLTLDGDDDVTVDAAIGSTAGQLGVAIDAPGNVSVNDTITTNGGDFDVTSAAAYTGNAAVATAGGAVNITTTGNQRYDDGAIDAGAGDVTLSVGGNVDEITQNQTPKITTAGTLTIDAVGNIGNGGAINEDSTPLMDVDAAVLDLEVTGAGNINVKNQNAAASTVNQAEVANGFVRLDTVGPMVLADNAVVVNNVNPGAGFGWLVSGSTIDALNPGNLVATVGPSANLRIDANDDIGTSANPLVVDTTGLFILVNRGPFAGAGSGSFYGTNQRAGQTNIVTMQLDGGDAAVTAPGAISIQDFSADFDTSFLGAGDFTVTSTGGSILAPSPVTMNGGNIDFTSAGDIGSAVNPLLATGFNGFNFDANGGAGNLFLAGGTWVDLIGNALQNLDPSTFAGFAIAANNVNLDVQPNAATDIDINELDLPVSAFDDGFVPLISSISGDINVLAGAIDLPMTGTEQVLQIIAQGGGVNLDPGGIDAGAGTVRLEARGGAIAQTGAGPQVTHNAGAGRVELVADTSVGASGAPIELAGTAEVVIDAMEDVYVDHDGATDIDLFSLTVMPSQGGAPEFSYEFNGFVDESFSGNANAIRDFGDDLLINDAQVQNTNTGTDYAFVAKDGDVVVDDNGTPDGDMGLDGIGDGGIYAGTGAVTLEALQGAIREEGARTDPNVRVDPVDSVANAGAGPVMGPLLALTADDGSIGDPTGGADGLFDVAGFKRFVLRTTGHFGVGGDGQAVELWDVTVDPAGSGIGGATPLYLADGFDAGFTHDVTSDGTDLLITELTSDHTFDAGRQGTRFSYRALSGDITVGDDTTGIRTELTNRDPLRDPDPVDSMAYFPLGDPQTVLGSTAGDFLAVRLVSDEGSVLLHDDAINVNGTGTVRLVARNAIDEVNDNAAVKITNAGLVQLFAENAAGAPGSAAIGGVVTDGSPDEALDLSTARIVAQAGQLLAGNEDLDGPSQSANREGGIYLHDRGAGGVRAVDLDTYMGDIDLRSVGLMAVSSDDPATDDRVENVHAGNADDAAGNGNVILVSEAGITEVTPAGGAATDPNVLAPGDQVALVGGGAIGAAGTLNFDIDAARLAARVDSGAAGGLFVRDHVGDLEINGFDVPAVGNLPGATTFDGVIHVTADGHNHPDAVGDEGVLAVTGAIATDPSAPAGNTVTLTGRQIRFANLGVPAAGTGGILDTDDIDLLADEGVFLDQAGLFTFRTAPGTAGRVSFGQFALPPVPTTTVDSGDGVFASLLVETDANGSIFFSGDVGATRRLNSLTTLSGTGATFINGDIFTRGGTQTFFNDVALTAADVHLDDAGPTRTSGVYFHGTLDGNGGGEGLSITVERITPDLGNNISAADPEVPLISFGGDVGVGFPLTYLHLNAYDADDNGSFTDPGDAFGRSNVPAVATIIAAARNPDGSLDAATPLNWTVNVFEDFVMGQNEKLTVNGSADINANLGGALMAGDPAMRLSDINAVTTLGLDAAGADIILLNTGRTYRSPNAWPTPPSASSAPPT